MQNSETNISEQSIKRILTQLKKQPSIADKKILTAQNIILDCFAKHNLFQY